MVQNFKLFKQLAMKPINTYYIKNIKIEGIFFDKLKY